MERTDQQLTLLAGLDPLPRTSCRLILSRLLSDVSPFKVDG
jgi:hypothetical protein